MERCLPKEYFQKCFWKTSDATLSGGGKKATCLTPNRKHKHVKIHQRLLRQIEDALKAENIAAGGCQCAQTNEQDFYRKIPSLPRVILYIKSVSDTFLIYNSKWHLNWPNVIAY